MTQSRFIPVAHPIFSGNEKKYVNQCLDEAWITSGEFVTRFEEAFARFCEVPHAVACNNGSSALHLGLLGFNLQPGDEVLVPTLTYVSCPNAVRYCGGRPVLVDSEPRTMTLDPARLEEHITPRTRGILVVHLYGHPADMDPILEIARRHNLFVLEDAAEAHGARYRGRLAGGLGDIGVFSFYGNKIVTTGEGGMVTTRDARMAAAIRQLAGQGVEPGRRYWFPIVGYNYRLTNLQAAIGLAQMEQVEFHMARHREVAGWYHRHLAPLGEFLTLPVEESWARHAWWMYTILLKDEAGISSDGFMRGLAAEGIETRPVFHPLHTMPPYYNSAGGRYPVAEDLARRGVTLPTHAMLTEEDVVYIAEKIRDLCRTGRPRAAASS